MPLTSYPDVYSRILLSLSEDGTPISAELHDATTAMRERMRFYNFLKYLRRHPHDAAHFAGRHQRVMVILDGRTLHFRLRTKQTDLSAELEEQLKAAVPTVPGAVIGAPPELPADAAENLARQISPEPVETSNPLATFNRFIIEKENKK